MGETSRAVRDCAEAIVANVASYDGDFAGDILKELRDARLDANPLRTLAVAISAIALGWLAPDYLWGFLQYYREASSGANPLRELDLYCTSSACAYDALGRDRLRAYTSRIAHEVLRLLETELGARR